MCEDKLVLSQEELVANRNQLGSLEAQIKELKTGHATLEKNLSKRDDKLKIQVEALQKLHKQQVTKGCRLEPYLRSPLSYQRSCSFGDTVAQK